MAELTPMMRQYFEIKNQNKDGILLYRLGDFYEMFYDDAKIASKELDLVLTGKNCGQEERAPMCGIPFHSCESYIAKLVKNGHKVFICEQTEDPKKAKGLVRREIIRTITPGTVIEASMLQEDCNNYIASVYFGVGGVGICFADITTGEILATDMSGEEMTIYTMNEIGRFTPKEVLLNPAAADDGALVDFLHEHMDSGLERMTEEQYDYAACEQLVRRQFAASAEPTIFTDHPMIVCAVGALLRYLMDTQQSNLSNLDTLQLYYQGQYLELDLNARRNLELFETMRTKEKRGSLLWVLDHTKTAMGARMLRQWMSKPLRSPNQIVQRQKAVGELKDDLVRRTALADELRQMFDIERLIGRIVYGTANCRDMRSMF
ncbi:MAG: DNA mismatch repair protein MutS, partial [Butyricicoccus sp.]|nr:DNA mismatch repair protein MutS [Butyricicoccus sp.]